MCFLFPLDQKISPLASLHGATDLAKERKLRKELPNGSTRHSNGHFGHHLTLASIMCNLSILEAVHKNVFHLNLGGGGNQYHFFEDVQ